MAVTPEVMRELERVVLLNITDTKWREHLYEMDYLQEGIHLRSYAQQDPLTEYRREAFDDVRGAHRVDPRGLRAYIYRVELVRQDSRRAGGDPVQRVQENRGRGRRRRRRRGRGSAEGGQARNPNQAVSDKMPRNAPCPCGSGKKYKKCHGAAA